MIKCLILQGSFSNSTVIAHSQLVKYCTPQIYARTADIAAKITLPEVTACVMPGDDANFSMKLMFSLPIEIGTWFIYYMKTS